jgi:CheY-like chemotaxis protein
MRTILVVEDNKINREMLSRRLERKGYRVLTAADGREGVAQTEAHHPDVVLMDMSMPIMDGWEATRRLKASPATRSIPVIALTAHAMLGDREKALEAGCDDYEMKPVELSRLVIKLEALFDKQAALPSTIDQTFSLLIVDDNEMNREVLARRLQRPEYRISRARSGREALDLINALPVDLVLLDAMMPEMSGLEVLQAIRTKHSIIELPVIMVTAKEQTEDVVAALEMGANDYVTKPLNFPVVLARVHTQLALKRAHLAGRAQPPAEIATPHVAPAPRTGIAPSVVRGTAPAGQAAADSAKRAGTRAGTVVWRNGRQAAGDDKPTWKDDHATVATSDTATRLNQETVTITPNDTWVPGLTRADQPRLSGYEILGEIGRGGMGVVYKARHERMNRIVAVKVIDRQHWTNADAIRRFYREVQAAAQLSHPNIVLAFDAGEYDDTHYFVMEYVEGQDLATLVKQHGPLSIDDACSCVIQTARGLQHAHERGMVHRDIKPGNLLATWAPNGPSGRPRTPTGQAQPLSRSTIKILDMGLALLHQPTELSEVAASLTRDNRVVGTADYMAPEQWMNAHKVDTRADLYSLGCSFYYLLTGEVPFPSVEPMEKMLKHHLDEPEPLERVRPGIPARVVAAVRHLMAKKPENRFQEPAELIAAIS